MKRAEPLDLDALTRSTGGLAYISDGSSGSEKLGRIVDAHPELIAELRESRAALARVRALIRAGRDGVRWVHNPGCEGEPTCPACWAADITNALNGEQK